MPTVALASEVVRTLSGVPMAVTVMLRAWVATSAFGLVESVTCIVKLKTPEEVGVPEITPVDAAKLKPAGNDPTLILQL